MSPTAVAESKINAKLREIRHDERAEKRRLRDERLAGQRREAERAVARETAIAEQHEKKKLADEVAARLVGGCWAEIHTAGHILTIDLSSVEPVSRSTAVECVRRAALQAANQHHARVVGSRAALKVLPADAKWISTFMQSEGGAYFAHKLGLIGVRADL